MSMSAGSDGITCPHSTADTKARVSGQPAFACDKPAAIRRRRTSAPIEIASGEPGPQARCLAILDSRLRSPYHLQRPLQPRRSPFPGGGASERQVVMSRAQSFRSIVVATFSSALLVLIAAATALAGDGGGPFPR
jgi:hypothetical protein